MSTASLRRILATGLATATMTALAALASGSHAQALSCVPHEITAQGLVAGEPDGTGRPIFETYDFAVTGTVTLIHTDESDGPEYGATEVHFGVINGYGVESIPAELIVSQGDPGWMTGYPFEVGVTYFLPLLETGPDGQPNYSFLCDPLVVLDEDEAIELPSFVASDVAVADPTPDTAAPAAPPEDDDTSPNDPAGPVAAPETTGQGGSGGVVASLTATVVLVVTAVTAIVLRRGTARRQRAAADGAELEPGHAAWPDPPGPRYRSAGLAKYAKLARGAETGAITNPCTPR